MKPQIIATGLNGLVGDRFQQLYADQYNFVNLDLKTGVDITDENSVKKSLEESRGEVVLHLAAFTNVNAAFDQTDDQSGVCYQVNVIGTHHVAQYCHQFGKYLIHISTDFVFDGTKTDPYTETDSPNPIEWYGKTKFLAEQEVVKAGGDYTILRLAYPYRAFHPERVDMVRNIIDKLKSDTMYPPFTDHTITPTFIDDLAVIFDLVAKKRPHQQIYHAVGSSWHTDYEIAQLINKAFKFNRNIKPGSLEAYLKANPRPYQKTLKISNQKLVKDLSFTPKTLEEGLKILKKQIRNL